MSTKHQADFSVKCRVLLADDIALGPGKFELLTAIQKTGSIAAAGRTMGMSYRRAWLLVDAMNRCFKAPLVESNKGGKNGGGAALTSAGEKVLLLYKNMDEDLHKVAKQHFKKIERLLRDTPSS